MEPPHSEQPQHAGYTFGDADVAAQRLRVVHDVFGTVSREFLAAVVTESPTLAYDLGCGPGHTTRDVARTTHAERTIGMDRSHAFIARAQADAPEGVEFLLADATAVPFPAGRADLVYARLLLAHLKDPAAVARTWVAEVQPGGVLALDEIEWIATDNPVLGAHLNLSSARVATTGAQMCAGPLLDELDGTIDLERRFKEVTEVPVATAAAATMFAMSLEAWGGQAVSDGLCDRLALTELKDDLVALRRSRATGEITWGLHQAAYVRPV